MRFELLSIFCLAALLGSGLVPGSVQAAPDYKKQVLPVLEQYCYDCHGDGTDKGNISLDPLDAGEDLLKDRELWKLVRHNLVQKVMPPEKKDQPSASEKALLVRWIDEEVFKVDCSNPSPGRVTFRRLNRVEYNNTVRDLLGVDIAPADDFPPDDTGYGYDNIGDVLTLSPIMLEKYTKAAGLIMEQFGSTGRDKEVLEAEDMRGRDRERRNRWVSSMRNEYPIDARFTTGRSGAYLLRVLAHADQAADETTRIGIRLKGGSKLGEKEVTGTEGKPQWLEFEVDLAAARTTEFQFNITNNFVDDKRKRGDHDRNIHVHRAELHPPATGAAQQARADQMQGGGNAGESRVSASSGSWIQAKFMTAKEGDYSLRVLASADQAGGETARVGAKRDWKTDLGSREVKAARGRGPVRPEWVQFELGKLPAKKEVSFQFNIANDFYDPKRKDGDRDRNIYVHRVEFVPPPSVDERKEVPPLDLACEGEPKQCAERALRPLLRRAFRRPPSEVEVVRHVDFHRRLMEDGESYQDALKVVAQAILISPHFLFRGDEKDGPLTEHRLAERLSYFLWSTMPDAELMALAEAGQLRKRLDAQVRRMLADERAEALEANFAGQWLQLRNLELVTPDTKRFPAFDDELRASMRRETELLFRHIRTQNRPVLELLDADYTYIDKRLAKHYGIPGWEKKEGFEYVKMHDGRRGGVLTHAGVLTLTSYATRTSPVVRGAWIMETLLGTPAPPPPEDVPELPAAAENGDVPLRKSLEKHRANPICASCHNRIDPLGFGLENFNAIGAWRDQEHGERIDASGKLLGGQSFGDHRELRKILATDKADQFTRSLVENMLTYGLGRGLEVEDVCVVDQICEVVKAGEYKFEVLVQAIVDCVAFQAQAAE